MFIIKEHACAHMPVIFDFFMASDRISFLGLPRKMLCPSAPDFRDGERAKEIFTSLCLALRNNGAQ